MAAAKGVVTLIKASTPRREEESHWKGGEEERKGKRGRQKEGEGEEEWEKGIGEERD